MRETSTTCSERTRSSKGDLPQTLCFNILKFPKFWQKTCLTISTHNCHTMLNPLICVKVLSRIHRLVKVMWHTLSRVCHWQGYLTDKWTRLWTTRATTVLQSRKNMLNCKVRKWYSWGPEKIKHTICDTVWEGKKCKIWDQKIVKLGPEKAIYRNIYGKTANIWDQKASMGEEYIQNWRAKMLNKGQNVGKWGQGLWRLEKKK